MNTTSYLPLETYTATGSNGKPIHYVTWEIGIGGIELSIIHYIRHFKGQRSLQAYSLRPVAEWIFGESDIQVSEGFSNNWSCYRAYYQYCRKHRNDLFHLMNIGPVVLLITLLAGVKNPVYHIHGTKHWFSKAKKIYLKTVWWLTSFFPFTLVANSNHSAGIFQKTVLEKPATIIYNGIPTGQFSSLKRRRDTLKHIGYAGRLNKGKNVEMVIEMFELLAVSRPELMLFIAGDGPLRASLEKQAAESPFSQRIRFLGMVRDMPSFYAKMDLLLFLSSFESFGNVLVEALLTGLPVLTSNIPAFDEIHGGDPDFLLGDPERPDEIRANLIRNVEQFPVLSRKAWEMSDEMVRQFSIESHIEKMENIYERID